MDATVLEESAAGVRSEDEVVAYLERILAGDYAAPPPRGSDRLSTVARELGRKLEDRLRSRADRVVDTAIEANEIAILAARMLDPLRKTTDRAQAMAAAVEELAASVKEIDQIAASAAGSAEEVSTSFADSVARVRESIEAFRKLAAHVTRAAADVQALGEASQEIGGIVGEIEKIASQTNLLALNATIEAARAGEAGRGFAVVANEVKSLSQQTAKATVDIRNRIEALLAQVQNISSVMEDAAGIAETGRSTVDELGQSMDGVGREVTNLSERVAEVAGIIRQQGDAVEEVSGGVAAVATMSADNQRQLEAIADATDRLDRALSRQIEDVAAAAFRGKVVRLAKADHVIWKRRLVAMAAGRLQLSPDELADHHKCRLGRWYYGDGGRRFADHPAFRELEPVHEAVHRTGKEAARRFAAGDLDGALKAIEEMEEASREVLRLLEVLRRADDEARAS
ncbi:MAG: hypothetical protein KatS3mg119_0499 [Rhodothalassiaceae bacterium]|nr:MAG: hypothetical protein KatS3mg119_0499 [Rhodothalassiaceae bacterium]